MTMREINLEDKNLAVNVDMLEFVEINYIPEKDYTAIGLDPTDAYYQVQYSINGRLYATQHHTPHEAKEVYNQLIGVEDEVND